MSRLYQRALRLLAVRSHSREELRRKLLRGISEPEAAVNEVLRQLEKKGYLNDEAFAYERALQQRRRRWGLFRIRRDLRSRGVEDRIIVPVLQRVGDLIPESSSLQNVIQHHLEKRGAPSTLSLLKKLYDRCIRLGYPGDQVHQELAPYFEKIDLGLANDPKKRHRR